MDYMNLHQSAHGDREFGFLCSRLRLGRKVIVGHWTDDRVVTQLASWARVALAWQESQNLRIVRFGDNMRQVAVTEGDKVEAQSVFGFSVNTHGVGDLVDVIHSQSDSDVDALTATYAEAYSVAPALLPGGESHASLREAARIELGLRSFLKSGGYGAFTDTFEDLHGLSQLPGLPVQRLRADGFGFGAEGDWKHAALLRLMKVLAGPADTGTSFMEDYTYHWESGSEFCLGAHMLEICPSIASDRPSCEIHPLGIGVKADPVRLVFDGKPGPASNVSLVDIGDRFRLIAARVDAVTPTQLLPKLPVARVLWTVRPSMETGVSAWIHAGGAHHTVFSYSVTPDQISDLATMAGVECILIDESTNLRTLCQELRWNDSAFR
ncbi:MAG: L-arabinose isomerase [Terrimicrobiaceae bacterium]